jgi:G3E family GTPase
VGTGGAIGELMQSSRMPITVIYGLPGSGKTTIAGYLSGRSSGQRIAVSRIGCRDAEFDQLRELATVDNIDYLLLEASGSCEPESVAARLTANSRAGAALAELVRLDTMVAVVDLSSFLADFCSWDLLADRGLAAHLADDRALVEALAEQIEFADVVILSKTDRASPSVRRSAGVLVRALNPEAVVIESEFGCVPPHKVLSTHAFEFARAQGRARWVQVLSGTEPSTDGTFGISSFLYQSRRPFHPQRLMQFVRSEWPGVVRCRGFFWLATRMDWMGEMSQAGASRRHRPAGSWWAAALAGKETHPQFMESLAGVAWEPRFGDRRQQLAFLGIDMDQAYLRSRLDECLLDDGEFARGPEAWQTYADPFPRWHAVAHAPAGSHIH